MSNIPCIIVNRDRLSTTRRLVIDLMNLGYTNIHILDMVSTYQPLLDWYKEQDIRVHYLKDNVGHKALWNSPMMQLFKDHEWIFYTDSDIQLNENTPKGFVEELITIAKDYRVDKAGLAIEFQDIEGPLANIIKPIEGRYWAHQLPHLTHICYNAPIDTTGAVIRVGRPFQYQAVRVAENFTCRHIPWYLPWDNLDEEELYFLDHADESISTYKQHYLKWIIEKAV